MSTVTDPKVLPQLAREDVFKYGFRDVLTERPDGSIQVTQIPLTLEDVLHPQQGDHVSESTLHDGVEAYLANVARARTYRDPLALVISNCNVFWDDPNLGHHCPDVGVIFNVRNRKVDRPSFYVAKEGTRPRLIIEIVSPHTRENDVEKKFDHYHRARVLRYVILDRLTEDSAWQIRGYQYAEHAYREMLKDEHGRLWLEDIGVWLATNGQQVICFDPVTGEAIPDYPELTQNLDQARQQLEAEKSRAEAEKNRAEAEVQARQAAEQRLRDLETELTRLRGQQPGGTKEPE